MSIPHINDKIFLNCIPVQSFAIKNNQGISHDVDVLRLDKIHPEISGNKWFKMRYFIAAFPASGKKALATFGGSHSNHIAATAAACHLLDIPVTGFIRGEEPARYSPTLLLARQESMELVFLSRADYKEKEKIMEKYPEFFWVPEGGYGILGAAGASTIWDHVPSPENYSAIFVAAGSGTTAAGLLTGALPGQQIMAVSVMKNNFSLQDEILSLTPADKAEQLVFLPQYHFGGYAKKTPALLDFMNACWEQYALPLDFVYTAKAFYALCDTINKGWHTGRGKILFVHTGGLQGNKSLPEGSLQY